MQTLSKKNSATVSVYSSIAELDENFIERWRALEARSIADNAYLSPDFVIPALKHLTPDLNFAIIAVENEKQMLALGVFEISKGNKQLPCPFLTTYLSPHSFIGGLLIDKYDTNTALSYFFNEIKNHHTQWHAIQFICAPLETAPHKIAPHVLKTAKIHRHKIDFEERAILTPENSGDEYLKENLSKNRIKSIERRKKRLKNSGKITWRVKQGNEITPETINTFLQLEDMGWRKNKGTSLSSNTSHKHFFCSMIERFSNQNKVFFTEIELNEKVIASTCNLVSGKTGFAFKLGWDSEYAKYGVGIMNEYELARHAKTNLHSLKYIDSGTTPGSFIEEIWPERRILFSGFYSLNKIAFIYLCSTQKFIELQNTIKNKFL